MLERPSRLGGRRVLGACEEGLLNGSLVSNHRASGDPDVAVLRADARALHRGYTLVSAALSSQDRIDLPPGDHPLLPFLLGCGQLGLNTVGLLTQAIDPTPSNQLVLFQ